MVHRKLIGIARREGYSTQGIDGGNAFKQCNAAAVRTKLAAVDLFPSKTAGARLYAERHFQVLRLWRGDV
eukprot:4004468-Prymnesium_polylepis.1